jgi:hypothetical protein
VVDFNLTTGYDCLEAHLHKLLTYLSTMYVLYSVENTVMDKEHFRNCNDLNTENNVVKICWDARRQMEFCQVPEH